MGNFSQDYRSGGRDFNRSGSFGGRGSDRPEMYKATCARCGKECEVPFRPIGSKPVYCRDCFKNSGTSGPRRDDRSFEKLSNYNRPMFDAVCANCGKNCKVPFQPGEGRQVLCSDCFEKKGGDPRTENNKSRNSGISYTKQFEELNTKLDKIMQLLIPPKFVVLENEKVISRSKNKPDTVEVPEDEAGSNRTTVVEAEKKKTVKKPRAKKTQA